MGGGREAPEGGTYVYLGLIHVAVWQKEIQYCKAIILQWKTDFKNGCNTTYVIGKCSPTNIESKVPERTRGVVVQTSRVIRA